VDVSGIPPVRAFAPVAKAKLRAAVYASVAAVSLAASIVGAYPFSTDRDTSPGYYVLLLSTPALAVLAMRVVMSRRGASPGRAAASLVALATLFGVINAVFGAVALAVAAGNPAMLVIATFFALFFGAPTGVAYGLAMSPLAGAAAAWIPRRELDAAERLLFVCAAWVITAAAGLGVATAVLEMGVSALASTGALLALGVGLGSVGAARRARRARWIARVRRGLEPGFRVRVASAVDAPAESESGLIKLRVGEGEPEALLEWLPDVASSAYRTGAAVPIARVPAR
jgi:hypothetical protein